MKITELKKLGIDTCVHFYHDCDYPSITDSCYNYYVEYLLWRQSNAIYVQKFIKCNRTDKFKSETKTKLLIKRDQSVFNFLSVNYIRIKDEVIYPGITRITLDSTNVYVPLLASHSCKSVLTIYAKSKIFQKIVHDFDIKEADFNNQPNLNYEFNSKTAVYNFLKQLEVITNSESN